MNQNVKKYLEILATHRNAFDKAHAARQRVERVHGIEYDAMQDPDYKALYEESTRLGLEADALTSFIIRENLARLELEDILVTAVIDDRDGEELGSTEMNLSDVCGLRHGGIEKLLGITTRDVNLHVRVLRDGQMIGRVDSDGDFNYTAAPDLKTAIGWKVATDGGRTMLIEGFDLDSAARMLLETIRLNGTYKEAFFGPYFNALKKIFVYEKTSRFSDGYCGAASTLWRVATRELGQEHEGYDFWY